MVMLVENILSNYYNFPKDYIKQLKFTPLF